VHLRLLTGLHFSENDAVCDPRKAVNSTKAQHNRDQAYFTQEIDHLFAVLANWKIGDATDGDITLELSAVDRMPQSRSEFPVQPFFRSWDHFADVDSWIKKYEAENRLRAD
jgi:hypothetical protein